MISDYLTADIGSNFPETGFQFSRPPQPVASLASPCEALGVLQVHDDGDEATVYIMGATHSHFGCYEEGLRSEEKEKKISTDVIAFLKSLLADRVVVWCALGGVVGGWRVLDPGEQPPRSSRLARKFVWSREVV